MLRSEIYEGQWLRVKRTNDVREVLSIGKVFIRVQEPEDTEDMGPELRLPFELEPYSDADVKKVTRQLEMALLWNGEGGDWNTEMIEVEAPLRAKHHELEELGREAVYANPDFDDINGCYLYNYYFGSEYE